MPLHHYDQPAFPTDRVHDAAEHANGLTKLEYVAAQCLAASFSIPVTRSNMLDISHYINGAVACARLLLDACAADRAERQNQVSTQAQAGDVAGEVRHGGGERTDGSVVRCAAPQGDSPNDTYSASDASASAEAGPRPADLGQSTAGTPPGAGPAGSAEEIGTLFLTGADMIHKERVRQITVEGYSHAHDDEHCANELCQAAICYIFAAKPSFYGANGGRDTWPFRDDFNPSASPIRNLVKAGALIAAEIDRLGRAKKAEAAEGESSQ